MKITISKSQWLSIGKKTGWVKTAKLLVVPPSIIKTIADYVMETKKEFQEYILTLNQQHMSPIKRKEYSKTFLKDKDKIFEIPISQHLKDTNNFNIRIQFEFIDKEEISKRNKMSSPAEYVHITNAKGIINFNFAYIDMDGKDFFTQGNTWYAVGHELLHAIQFRAYEKEKCGLPQKELRTPPPSSDFTILGAEYDREDVEFYPNLWIFYRQVCQVLSRLPESPNTNINEEIKKIMSANKNLANLKRKDYKKWSRAISLIYVAVLDWYKKFKEKQTEYIG